MFLSVLQAFITVGTSLLQSGFPHPIAEVTRNLDWYLRHIGGDTVLLEGGGGEGDVVRQNGDDGSAVVLPQVEQPSEQSSLRLRPVAPGLLFSRFLVTK